MDKMEKSPRLREGTMYVSGENTVVRRTFKLQDKAVTGRWKQLLNHELIQGIHKRMVRFQKLTRNLFLILHGHNVHRQQRQLSKFLMRYQQFASHAYCGAAGRFQDGVAAGKGFLCAPF